MTAKEKAKELFDIYECITEINYTAKQCALIAVENEYKALRELLFNLRARGVDISEIVYLKMIKDLIDEEQEVKQEIEKL
jgi:hypothetical protein